MTAAEPPAQDPAPTQAALPPAAQAANLANPAQAANLANPAAQAAPLGPPAQAAPIAPPIGAVALWMGGAIAGFTAMAVAGRSLAGQHDTFEIMLWRSLIGLGLVLAWALGTGRTAALGPRNLGLHAARNISHFIGQNLWFAALPLIPLAQIFALEFSYPLMVALAAPFVLGEALTGRRIGAAALGFAGVVIVARPWNAAEFNLGTALVLAAAFGFAGSALATKALTRRASLTEILFWVTLMQLGLSLACALYDGQMRPPTAQSLPALMVIGLAGLGAHLCMTQALSLAPASVVAPFDFLRLPVSALIGAALYGEPVTLSLALGGAIILAANWLNLAIRPKN